MTKTRSFQRFGNGIKAFPLSMSRPGSTTMLESAVELATGRPGFYALENMGQLLELPIQLEQ